MYVTIIGTQFHHTNFEKKPVWYFFWVSDHPEMEEQSIII